MSVKITANEQGFAMAGASDDPSAEANAKLKN
jgi:hypothetical protein